MITRFESGKIYKFIESGEALPVENDYKAFYQTLIGNINENGIFKFNSNFNIVFVPIMSGTIALCLGIDEIDIVGNDLKTVQQQKCFKFLIENQITILLQREKNLYSYIELDETA